LIFRVPVDFEIYGAFLEFHFVFGKSSGLVTENEFNLAEFFNEIGASNIRPFIEFGPVHVNIVFDKTSFEKF
jgi:hypothetical protein